MFEMSYMIFKRKRHEIDFLKKWNRENASIWSCLTLHFLLRSGRMSEDRVVLGGLDRVESRLKNVKHLVIAACGTSLYASMYGAKLMRDLEALDTVAVRVYCILLTPLELGLVFTH